MTGKERSHIYEKTNGHCAYCGCKLRFEQMTVDHIKPIAHGGKDTENNMLPACRSCNHRKGTSSVDSFREQVERFPEVLMRDSVTYRNAVRFGLVNPNPHSVEFYFEKLRDATKEATKRGDTA
jgi:hypothetical protein